jgi:hypothetical protein
VSADNPNPSISVDDDHDDDDNMLSPSVSQSDEKANEEANLFAWERLLKSHVRNSLSFNPFGLQFFIVQVLDQK